MHKKIFLKGLGIFLLMVAIEDYIELWYEVMKGKWIYVDDFYQAMDKEIEALLTEE